MITTLLIAAALADTPPHVDNPHDARPRRSWDISHVDLDVLVDLDTHTVSGTVEHTISPIGPPSSWLRLDQVAITFGEVTVDGEVVAVRTGPSTVEIPVTPGADHVVRITYSATPQTGVHFRDKRSSQGVVGAWTQGENNDNRHWFPGWDYPSDTFTVTSTLTVPDGLHAVANGVLKSKEASADHPKHTRWTYTLEQPIVNYLVAFAVGDTSVWTSTSDVPLEIIAPRTLPEATVRNGADEVVQMMPWMAALLGEPYPYPVYRQVYVQRFMYGGMENASMTVLSDAYLVGEHDLGRGEVSRVVAHELAHQWFGDLITTHGWRELWLNEGFATFYAARWGEHLLGDEEYTTQMRRMAGPASHTRQPMANRGWSKPGASDHHAQYVRGAHTLHMLRMWLGDALFDEAIATYVAEHRFSLVETADLRQVFERISGYDLRWFFDRFVHGWGAPDIHTRWSQSGEGLTVTLKQSGEVQAYEGPLRIDWGDESGVVHSKQLWLAADTTTLQLDADAVAWVSVDPVGGVLAHWTHKQPPTAWAAQAADAPTAHARFDAIEALGDPEGQPEIAVPVLRAFLLGEHRLERPADAPYDTQRFAQAAATALGKLGIPTARDALLEGLQRDDAVPEVRVAIARALGSFGLDEQVVPRLTKLVGSDPMPGVQAAALLALHEARPSVALTTARTALERKDRSIDGDLTEAALDVLTLTGELSDLGPALPFTRDTRRDVQHTAAQTLVTLAHRHEADGKQRARIAKALVPWLQSDDLRTRRFAIMQLAKLGSTDAIPALRAFATLSSLPDHRSAALAAITSIRAHDGKVDDPDALKQAQATLDALQERLDEVEERLHDLETW